jgi:hypothetical protein
MYNRHVFYSSAGSSRVEWEGKEWQEEKPAFYKQTFREKEHTAWLLLIPSAWLATRDSELIIKK